MRTLLLVFISLIFLGCAQEQSIHFELVDGSGQVIEILPTSIDHYKEEYTRGYLQIQSIELDRDFYGRDTVTLTYPVRLQCYLSGELFFSAEQFLKYRSAPKLGPMFRFDPTCKNDWEFNEAYDYEAKKMFLITTNDCNSIELIYQKDRIEEHLDYYKSKQYFNDYLSSGNKLAHEFFLDEDYLRAVRALKK